VSLSETKLRDCLAGGGLPGPVIATWFDSRPDLTAAYHHDAAAFSRFWRLGADLVAALPAKPQRTPAEAAAARAILDADRAARDRFLAIHAGSVYLALTQDLARFVRVEQLVYDAAELLPGLAPTEAQVAAEGACIQRDKDGIEIDQGILLACILADPVCGAHLCQAMLQPKAASRALLPKLAADGALDLGGARIERRGKASIVTMRNPRFLNAEDEETLGPVETAVDLAILDPATEIAVLRGDVVDHPKYRGRPVFSTGINLTHLYHGKISYIWYAQREMGFVNKMFRGLAGEGAVPDDVTGFTIEKPWVAAVDAFAIGGGCQYLLAMDYVLAARDAYLTLPARKEGIIPGAANLRLPRFTGDRIARQLIMVGRRLDCDSPEGRLICDEIAEPAAMDATLARVIDDFTSSGVVSAAGNRRAFRVGAEPLDLFRQYMSVYAREQASCHFSPALIANLERHWHAQRRKP
jgi:thioesterase DpgC